MIVFERPPRLRDDGISSEPDDDHAEECLDDVIADERQEEQPERNAKERRRGQPPRAPDVDLSPILDDDQSGNQHRYDDRERRGGSDRKTERQEGHRDQRFPKPNGRSNNRRQEDDANDVGGGRVDHSESQQAVDITNHFQNLSRHRPSTQGSLSKNLHHILRA